MSIWVELVVVIVSRKIYLFLLAKYPIKVTVYNVGLKNYYRIKKFFNSEMEKE